MSTSLGKSSTWHIGERYNLVGMFTNRDWTEMKMNNLQKMICVLVLACFGLWLDSDVAQSQLRATNTKRPVDALSDTWTSKGSINWEIASVLGLLSKTAYEDDDELMGFVAQGMGFNSVKSFKQNNSAAHVLIGDRVIVVAFRGTEFTSLADWKTDIYMNFFRDVRLGNVHSGFNTAYEDVRVGVERMLRANPEKTLWITGHSLGGAMAVICAARCKLDRVNDNARIVTFGQPRVGDSQVAKWIDDKYPKSYQRFVNDLDIVARLPFSNYWFPYSDAGRFIHLDQGAYRISDSGFVGSAQGGSAVPAGDGTANVQEQGNVTIRMSWITNAPVQQITWDEFGQPRMMGRMPGNQSSRKFGEVYQSGEAMNPVDLAELDQLILEEKNIRDNREGNLFFPDDEELKEKQLQPMMVGPGGIDPVHGNMVMGTSWLPTDKITDHYMDGYLKILRGLRD